MVSTGTLFYGAVIHQGKARTSSFHCNLEHVDLGEGVAHITPKSRKVSVFLVVKGS